MRHQSERQQKNIQLPFLDDFLLSLQTNNLSNETVYNYERDLNVFQNFLNEINTSFEKIDKRVLLNYKAYLSSQDRCTPKNKLGKRKLSSSSINRMLSALRSYLKFLIDMDYHPPVTPEMVKLIKMERKTPRIADLEEIIKLIEAPSHFEKNKKVALRNRAILEVLFSTGMRISELTNLKTEQIDKQGRIFIMGKGKKERFVYLTPRAQHYLQKYYQIRGKTDSPYVFVPYRGKNATAKYKKISPNYIQERLKKYRSWLGINVPVSPHGLRRAFATFLAEKGASPAAIQILLGHESLDTTTRYVNASVRYAEKVHRKFHPLQK
jgi:site-specific recombinase XerD